MTIPIHIPTALRQYANNQDAIEIDGQTVGEILQKLSDDYPELRHHLFGDDGNLRNFVNVYVNDDDIRYLKQNDTELKPGDALTIVPAVAGGALVSEAPAAVKGLVSDEGVTLSKEEIERYSRHLIIPEFTIEGQRKLKAASVLVIGTGGLGSPLALYLAAAGIGKLGLVDFDVVDATNLQRQIIHGTSDVGRPKLDSAKDGIKNINPHVEVESYNTFINSDNALDIMRPYDIIIDGTDNFPTRYLVNDACVLLGKPNVYGSIFRFEGQASVFWADEGPCYRCLYPEPPPPGLVPSCAEGGVIGVLPGIIGVIQATEAVKLITGIGETLIGRLLLYNALNMSFRELKLRKDPECPICGENPTVTELIDYQHFCGIGTDDDQIRLEPEQEISPEELKGRLEQGESLTLLDVREDFEYEICHLPDATLIPVNELERRVGELDRDKPIVALCRTGPRSARATKFLSEAGFKKVQNLVGGVIGWADKIDPDMPKY